MSKHKDRRNLFQKKTQPPSAQAAEQSLAQKGQTPPSPEHDECEAEEPDFTDMTFSDAFRYILNEAIETGRLPDVASHGAFSSAAMRHKKLNLRNQTAHVNELRQVSGQAANTASAIASMIMNLVK